MKFETVLHSEHLLKKWRKQTVLLASWKINWEIFNYTNYIAKNIHLTNRNTYNLIVIHNTNMYFNIPCYNFSELWTHLNKIYALNYYRFHGCFFSYFPKICDEAKKSYYILSFLGRARHCASNYFSFLLTEICGVRILFYMFIVCVMMTLNFYECIFLLIC